MDVRFSQFEILTGAGSLFLALFFVCVFTEASAIENTVGSHAMKAVTTTIDSNDLFWTGVEAHGQNIVLTGAAAHYQYKMQAEAIAAGVPGVTGVVNQIAVIGEAGTCQNDINKKLADERVSFKTGKADISDKSFALLGRLASIARGCNVHMEIAGHTDATGDSAVNMKLSQRRADAVVKYLVSSGVDIAQVTAKGYGENQPIADNSTETGRRTNRRIEFRVLGAMGEQV